MDINIVDFNKESIFNNLINNINYIENLDINNIKNTEKILHVLKESILYCNKLNLYNEIKIIKNIINKTSMKDNIEIRLLLEKPYLYIDNDSYSDRYGFYGQFKKNVINQNNEYSYRIQYDIYHNNLNKKINPDYLIRSYKNIVLNTTDINLKNECLKEIHNLYKTSYSIDNMNKDYFYIKNYNNNSKESLVTIIVTSYNQEKYIEECLISILDQNYSNIELIIADDCSKNFDIDYYKNFIEKYMKNNINRLIIYKNIINLGTASNLNKARCFCNGIFIKTIGSDDAFYSNDVLKIIVDFMLKNNCKVLESNIELNDINMNKLEKSTTNIETVRNSYKNIKENYNKQNLIRYFGYGNVIGLGGCFIHIDIFNNIRFNEEFLLLEDLPYVFEIILNDTRIDYIDMISLKYRLGSGVTSITHPDKRRLIGKEADKFYDELYYPEYYKYFD